MLSVVCDPVIDQKIDDSLVANLAVTCKRRVQVGILDQTANFSQGNFSLLEVLDPLLSQGWAAKKMVSCFWTLVKESAYDVLSALAPRLEIDFGGHMAREDAVHVCCMFFRPGMVCKPGTYQASSFPSDSLEVLTLV